MAAEAACFSASEEEEEEDEAAAAAAAASLASISEGSRGSCLGSRSGGCDVAVEDEIGAVCVMPSNRIRTGNEADLIPSMGMEKIRKEIT